MMTSGFGSSGQRGLASGVVLAALLRGVGHPGEADRRYPDEEVWCAKVGPLGGGFS